MSNEEAQMVINVPIPMVLRADELRWPFDRGGKVTTKSAYHCIRAQREAGEDTEATTRVGPARNLWDMIWKTNTLPKIKTFYWKLVAKAVAIREELARRGVQVQTTCPMCDQMESWEHLIWVCAWVKPVWEELLNLLDASEGCQTVNDWLMKRGSEGGGLWWKRDGTLHS